MVHPSVSVPCIRLDGDAAPHDVEIELTDYVYDCLGLPQKRGFTISIRRSAMHVVPVTMQSQPA